MEILPIQPEQVEGVEVGLAAAEHEVIELRSPLLVETDDLAVQDRVLCFELSGYGAPQALESLVDVPLPRSSSC